MLKDPEYRPKHGYKIHATYCPKCQGNEWAIGKLLCASGQIKFPWFCRACNKRTSFYEPNHSHIVYAKVFDDRAENECEKCGRIGAELHHWMPRHLAPDTCEKWPVGYLCQECHSTWHNTVTPGMSDA